MSDPNFPPPPPGGNPPPPPGGNPPPPPPPPGGGYGAPPPPPGGFGGPPGGSPPPPPGGFGGPPTGMGGPPGGFTPPPAQPYGGGQERPQLDVGSAISYGWKKFSENAGQFIAMMIAVAVVTIVCAVLTGLLSATGSIALTDSGLVVDNRVSFAGLIWNLAVTLVFYSIIFLVQAGIWRAGLGVTRGETPAFSQLTSTDNFGPYVLTAVLVFVVPNLISSLLGWFSGILSLIFILPMIAWIITTAFAPLFALDKGLGPVEAVSRSFKLVTENLGSIVAILIVSYLVYLVGICLCGVGWLVTAPTALVAITYTYRALNNEMVAP